MDEEYGAAGRGAKRCAAEGGRRGTRELQRPTREDPRPIDPAGFRSALLHHFHRHRRPLPWRTDRTPYRVMVSEFMLQQTRAETVGPYYARWLRRFPDWSTLAAATPDDVILEWKGLGYYSRARNLHRTAREVRERYGGELPGDPAELKTLPGVGEYTAGAVASIAFGKPVPAVDGNVRRVLARLLDLPEPTPAQLRREAARLLDPDRPGDHNEAMMELGATICAPRTPRCEACPIAAWCAALSAGTVADRPSPPRRRPVPRLDYATAVALDPAGRALLVRRPEKGLLAGMWEFPSVEVPAIGANRATSSAKRANTSTPGGVIPFSAITTSALQHLATLGLDGHLAATLTPVRHAFTHLRATYHPVVMRCDPRGSPLRQCGAAAPALNHGEAAGSSPTTAWVHPADLDDYALPVAQQKIGRLIEAWFRGNGQGQGHAQMGQPGPPKIRARLDPRAPKPLPAGTRPHGSG